MHIHIDICIYSYRDCVIFQLLCVHNKKSIPAMTRFCPSSGLNGLSFVALRRVWLGAGHLKFTWIEDHAIDDLYHISSTLTHIERECLVSYVYIYIYICISINMYIYMYMSIYTYTYISMYCIYTYRH